MLLLSLTAALMLQTAPSSVLPSSDTVDAVYDSPATRLLVERVIRESGEVPQGLRDFRAMVRTTMNLALAPDSSLGGDLPITVDELAGELRWARTGQLHQWVREHRMRLLVPAPYTLGTLIQEPWAIPHLYGPTIAVFSLSAEPRQGRAAARSAVHPFGPDGPRYYRYTVGDTVRIRVRDETVTLVPVEVRPRVAAARDAPQLVVGSFFIDTRRAAVARARFGYVEPARGLRLSRTGTFLELENGLWQGEYWLPFRQRREVQIASSVFGGAVAGRIVSEFTDYELNTGWSPSGSATARLFREPGTGTDEPVEDAATTLETAEWNVDDFADLRRLAVGAARPDRGPLWIAPGYERSDHLFRYNRVEGPYLGLGIRVAPRDPRERQWNVYATGGWAFAEATPRGEVLARWRTRAPPLSDGFEWGATAGVYRRLRDMRAFDPTFRWDFVYTLPALLGGSDLRDYYDAAGAELMVSTGVGPWAGQLGIRGERQDSVTRNTDRYLFGTAPDFPPLAPAEPGTHVAGEAGITYSRGSGAFGIVNSTVASLNGEVGVADFRFGRAVALVSLRRSLSIFTLAGRVDAGHAWGEVPPQKLFRFGVGEGLRGYEPNEFGGSSAAVARGRFLIGLPPYSSQPLARSGIFILPPLRPALVLLGESGWADVSDRARTQLQRTGSVPTDGARGSVGAGLSIFNDFFTIEWVRPLESGREGRWYVGLVQWF
jgi:hypothetical protein